MYVGADIGGTKMRCHPRRRQRKHKGENFGVPVAIENDANACALDMCDVTLKVPETETSKIQECHLPIYHFLCAEQEKNLYRQGENL